MSSAPRRGAVVIAVGDEVLGGFTLDTNSHFLAGRLREAGWPLLRIEVVGDVDAHIAAAVRRAVDDEAAARIVVSGGLGPTPDDRTLEAVAAALGRPLEVHPAALAHVQGIVDRMHDAGWVPSREISVANRKMTMAPQGSSVLENRRGMASGIVVPLDDGPCGDRCLLILPGVPRELESLVTEEAIPTLFAGGVARTVVELRYRFAIEAQFTEPMVEVGAAYPEVSIGSYPQSDRRELVIRLSGDDSAQVVAAAERMRSLRPLPEGAAG